MIKRMLDMIFGTGDTPTETPRDRIEASRMPAALYAIGDVHGRLDLLKALEAQIFADGAALVGEKWIVMLGDLIDRGPASAQVLDHVQMPVPAGWRRICLCGNHDHAMVMAMQDMAMFEQWLSFGGIETLASYGLDPKALAGAEHRWTRLQALLESHIPAEHIQFLRTRPIMLQLPGYVFVHAGLRPGVPLDQQTDHDLMWIRPNRTSGEASFPFTIVHGHTPTESVDVSSRSINLDTGAFASGILSAVRLTPDAKPVLLQVSARHP